IIILMYINNIPTISGENYAFCKRSSKEGA
ncbi:unnamed protein product, partial [marine sediment metagenome]